MTDINMNTVKVLTEAILNKAVVEFYYDGGIRVVEPHMVALNEAEHLSLSGWFLRGYSSTGGQGWREYLVSEIVNLTVLNEGFAGARPGYQASGGKKFHGAIAKL